MGMIIVAPAPIAAVAASRGTAATNLLSPEPKEAWVDSAVGSAVSIDIDLGTARSIDTIFLGHVDPAAAGAAWAISGGAGSYTDVAIKASGPLRVPDSASEAPSLSHGLWHGAAVTVRYLRLSVTQPGGSPALSVGTVIAGRAFQPALGRDWGSGRQPIDLSSVTRRADGGFAVVPGARVRSLAWTFSDLTPAEVDALEAIAMDRGESEPLLIVEDPAPTTGLLRRIFYCKFETFRRFDRRNIRQTRWELAVEEWA